MEELEELKGRPRGLRKWEDSVPGEVLDRIERAGAKGLDWHAGRSVNEPELSATPEQRTELRQQVREYRQHRRHQRLQRVGRVLRHLG